MKADLHLEPVYTDKHYQLVADCRQGDKKACYELYRLYARAMMNVAYRIVGNTTEAEDILQEAFLDAFSKIQHFRQETTFGLWLKQIVVHRAINLLRKRKTLWIEAEETDLEAIAEEEPDDLEEILYKVEQVKVAIHQLPEGYRIIISLYLLEGYDHEEIGQILNISENTSRTQLLRAKRKLCEMLKSKGFKP
jgi:RNA polymerase sigma-70 factor (ECF subfamily)